MLIPLLFCFLSSPLYADRVFRKAHLHTTLYDVAQLLVHGLMVG